jgi:4-hydroxyphenylpyruvate dioxygenase
MSEKVGEKRKMVGFDAFMMNRTNPMSDLFDIHKFDHLEFYCSDATQASRRFSWGLGLPLVGKSDVTTGNTHFSSHVLKGNDITFIFTAPYCDDSLDAETKAGEVPIFKEFSQDLAHNFVRKHGLAVRAVGIRVKDAAEAFTLSTAAGAVAATPPYTTVDKVTSKSLTISEIKLFGDSLIRWVSGDFDGEHPYHIELFYGFFVPVPATMTMIS